MRLVWKAFVWSVIPSSSELLYPDCSSVFVLFILVRSLHFRDCMSRAEGNKEQVLATMVLYMVIRRSVSIPVGP